MNNRGIWLRYEYKSKNWILILERLDIIRLNGDLMKINLERLVNITDEEVLRTRTFGPKRLEQFKEIRERFLTLLELK